MNFIKNARYVLKINIQCELQTPLLLRSGKTGDFTDSTIERTPDNRLHINGYVWASLFRRSLSRINGYEDLVAQIGKSGPENGISSLWCETTITDQPVTSANVGISIDRETGAAKNGALFSDELVISGTIVECNLAVFVKTIEESEYWQKALNKALSIINQGIENIGGGWTYGYGRLTIRRVQSATIDLTKPEQRKTLWSLGKTNYTEQQLPGDIPQNTKPVSILSVSARITPGQLMAIKSSIFPLNAEHFGKLPDSFVFRRNRLIDGALVNDPVLPGKALRQALFSVPLERKWRSYGEEICSPSTNNDCGCLRCQWFGSTSAAGVIAVSDAIIHNPIYEVINRIQLCEHSMQNMNLFSGEYLTRGDFTFKIIVDENRTVDTTNLLEELELLLDEMRGEQAPPGWQRIGGTSTCTGQVQILDYSIARSV